MKSNYEPLAKHIRLVDCRNKENISDKVLGINIDKFFMPSVANIIGTDLSKYKLISKGLFACNPMHVGRDERLPIALYTDDEPALVSPAYFMFEIIDTNILDNEYLMLWFRRSEFDRTCWFRTDGSVRGGITWDDLCSIEVPIISIEEQRHIVESYNIVTKRIELKRQINENLVDTIKSVFFEQFGSVINKINSVRASKEDLNSINEIKKAVEYFDITIGKTPPRTELECFSCNSNDNIWISIADLKSKSPFVSKSSEYLTNTAVTKYNVKRVPENSVLLSFKMTIGRTAIVNESVTTNEAIAHFPCNDNNIYYTYCYLTYFNYDVLGSTSSITTAINSKIIKDMPFYLPKDCELQKFNKIVMPLFDYLKRIEKEIVDLNELKGILLCKLSSN